jgi:hypothetical protein
MTVYRMYRVGEDGHFKQTQTVGCASDQEALAMARTMIGESYALEVWE